MACIAGNPQCNGSMGKRSQGSDVLCCASCGREISEEMHRKAFGGLLQEELAGKMLPWDDVRRAFEAADAAKKSQVPDSDSAWDVPATAEGHEKEHSVSGHVVATPEVGKDESVAALIVVKVAKEVTKEDIEEKTQSDIDVVMSLYGGHELTRVGVVLPKGLNLKMDEVRVWNIIRVNTPELADPARYRPIRHLWVNPETGEETSTIKVVRRASETP